MVMWYNLINVFFNIMSIKIVFFQYYVLLFKKLKNKVSQIVIFFFFYKMQNSASYPEDVKNACRILVGKCHKKKLKLKGTDRLT
jgi:hypothetical protein